MKASFKMRQTIAMLEKKYGEMEKDFGIEVIESNRTGRGFYDYCILTDKIIKSRNITVAHDGSYHIN